MVRRLPALLLALAAASLTAPAAARPPGWDRDRDDWPAPMLRYDMGIAIQSWPRMVAGGASITGLQTDYLVSTNAFDVFYHRQIARHAYLDFELPVTFTVAALPISATPNSTAHSIGGMGNVYIGAHFGRRLGIFSWWAGGGLGLPFGAIKNPNLQLADGLAGQGAALWDAHLWSTASMPFVGRFGAQIRPVPPLTVRLQFDPMTFIPTVANVWPQVITQERLEIEARAHVGVGGGLALQASTRLTNAPFAVVDDSKVAASLKAYFLYDNGRTFFMRLGGLLALSSPLGVGFERGKVLSAEMLFGGYLTPDADD